MSRLHGLKPRFPRIFLQRLQRFWETEEAGGIVMLAMAAFALVWVHTPWSGLYWEILRYPVTMGWGSFSLSEPFYLWVQDVLMVLFFFAVGLELKREGVDGFLSDRRQILLPLGAAIGGMVLPALVFLALNAPYPDHYAGWAVSGATDIAFAITILRLVGGAISPATKIFLLAIAIFDDIGAIVVIALFYTKALSIPPLLFGAVGVGVLFLFDKYRVRPIWPYVLMGIFLWFCCHASGVHATVAGVITGLFMPHWRSEKTDGDGGEDTPSPEVSPLDKALHILHPWVSFAILPLFAFTAAGVDLSGLSIGDLLSPLPLGIALGLFIGKQIGVFGCVAAMVKMKWAPLPEKSTWFEIYGISILCGIGFTMSLFIGMLAFQEPAIQDQVKIGVLLGSCASGLLGWVVLKRVKSP